MAKGAGRGKLDRNMYWRGGTIWARIQIAGRDVRRSLHTGDRAEARRKLQGILKDAERIRFGEEGRHKYVDAAVAWAEARFGGVRESSANRYRASLRMMHEHFSPLYLDQINAREIGKYVRQRTRDGASNATIRRDLSAGSRLIANAVALGWMEDNPFKAWDRSVIKQARYLIERVDPRSFEAVCAVANPTFAAYMRFLLADGMRADEGARTLRKEAVAGKATIVGKTGRRTITLSPESVAIAEGMPQHLKAPWLFYTPEGERYTRPSQRFLEFRLAAQKKAQREGVAFKPFRLHDLRHEYAIRYVERGGSLYDLQQHLGHSSIKTTEIYLAFLTPDQQKVAKRMSAQNAAQGERIHPVNPLSSNGDLPDVD